MKGLIVALTFFASSLGLAKFDIELTMGTPALFGTYFEQGAFHASFMPENDLYKQDKLHEQAAKIQKIDFDAAIAEVAKFYAPLIKGTHGADLVFVKAWADPTVNAYAIQYGSRWEIHMFGGLARRPEVTRDGFQLVACHEMGHHLGGFPMVSEWAANEGQADYFATLACGRVLWKDQVAKNAASARTIAAYPKQACDIAWRSTADRNLCYRLAQAGKSLADLLSGSMARYETPDPTVVDVTINEHPAGQCRLDTYLAAAFCPIPWDNEVIPQTEEESAQYTCNNRPRCWFKPSEQ